MNYHEKMAKALLDLAHERTQRDEVHKRPPLHPLGYTGGMSEQLHHTFYRRQLMAILGIPVTRRWLRRK